MEQQELDWNTKLSPDQLSQVVADVAVEFGLGIGPETALKTIQGSQHWHLKKGRQAGVLEVTLLARERRGTISVHANRNADWIVEVLPGFRDRLMSMLQ